MAKTGYNTYKFYSINAFVFISLALHASAAILIYVGNRNSTWRNEQVITVDLPSCNLPTAAPATAAVAKRPSKTTACDSAPSVETANQKTALPALAAAPLQPVPVSASVQTAAVSSQVTASTTLASIPLPAGAVSGTSISSHLPATGRSTAQASGGQPAPPAEVPFGGVTGPSFLQRTHPTYPLVAKRFNREGKVLLRLTIDESGTLKHVEVLEDPGYGFAAAAVEAVKKSRFSPAHDKEKPISAKALLPIRFALRGTN